MYTIKFAVTRKRGWPARLVTRYLGRNDGEALGRSEDSKHGVRLHVIEGETARSYTLFLSQTGRDTFPTVHAVCS